ncbi:MAG TPA: response regulator [Bryobacteraceae bacterium]|nr:response regulator [Bryobacteraceae bacterium]
MQPSLLLVEDCADDIMLAERALAKNRVQANMRVARSGREAWDLLGEETGGPLPKAVFLDLNMPDWNGFDLLRRLRANDRTKSLPVVILTTSKEPADIERSYELGANSFVTKPVDFMEFSETFAKMTGYWMNLNEVDAA